MRCPHHKYNKVCCSERSVEMCTAPDCAPGETYQHAQECGGDRQRCPLGNYLIATPTPCTPGSRY